MGLDHLGRVNAMFWQKQSSKPYFRAVQYSDPTFGGKMVGLTYLSVGSKLGSVWAVRKNGKVYKMTPMDNDSGVDVWSNTEWTLMDQGAKSEDVVPMFAVASSDYF